MYIATHINCNARALGKISLGKHTRESWLISNLTTLLHFNKVCAKPGSQVRLLGVKWDHDSIPENQLIFRSDNGKLKARSI